MSASNSFATFVTAEIGINHGGSIDTALKLIDAAIYAGCDAVKFQKRSIDICYTPDELTQPRQSPFGTTNGDLKRALEFGQTEYEIIDVYCREKGILWYASPWDMPSVDFLHQFNPPYYKVASARNTDISLMRHIASKGKPVILSTGMATMDEVVRAMHTLHPVLTCLMVCTATYPAKLEELNLKRISNLIDTFPIRIGYSGHESGLWTSLCAIAMGATYLERHITLDRSSYGSDQSASIEPEGFKKLVREIRDFEIALGAPELNMLESEKTIALKLRR